MLCADAVLSRMVKVATHSPPSRSLPGAHLCQRDLGDVNLDEAPGTEQGVRDEDMEQRRQVGCTRCKELRRLWWGMVDG